MWNYIIYTSSLSGIWRSQFPLRLDYGRSPHAYVNQGLQRQSSWWWEVYRSKHIEPLMNGGIINSITRLHLVGYFSWVILRWTDTWILNLVPNIFIAFFCSFFFLLIVLYSAWWWIYIAETCSWLLLIDKVVFVLWVYIPLYLLVYLNTTKMLCLEILVILIGFLIAVALNIIKE
jgi:hypothetical protein